MPAAPVRLDAADGLVRALEARGTMAAADAARILLANASGPERIASAVLAHVVAADARLVWRDGAVALAPAPAAAVPLERARFCVVDLETTGLAAGRSRISEIGAVLVRPGRPRRELELLVPPARPAGAAVRRLLAFAGDAVLAGHNVSFDLAFVDHEARVELGGRVATPVVDTMRLARRLLGGRVEGLSLAALAEFVGAPEAPCHRALPDARATASVLAFLVDEARERGARSVGDLCALSRVPVRRGR
jgi:DNA polymerase III epsilon subunit-like protein